MGASSGSRAAVDEPRRFTGGPSAAGDRGERARRCGVGINVALYKLQLFVFAAALAGLAGGLFTFYAQFLGPEDFVIVLSLFFVVMVSIGGLGSIYGAVVGAITPSTSSTSCVSRHARDPPRLGPSPQGPSILSLGVFGLLLIVIMLFFPHGLVPGSSAVASRRRLEAPAWRRSTS